MHLFEISLLGFAWLAILVGGCLGWQLLRQNGRILMRLDEPENRLNELEFGEGEEPAGLPVGSEAPAFELADLSGEPHALAEFRGQPFVLVFFNPDCGFCRESCPYGAVFTTFTRKHQYAIMADGCMWCGGPGKAPCEVYCPVPGAIVPATYDPVHGLMLNGG